jgi:hypothetical protein
VDKDDRMTTTPLDVTPSTRRRASARPCVASTWLSAVLLFVATSLPVAADVPSSWLLKERAIKKLTASSPPAADDSLVPGWRAGQIHLGMTAAQLLAAMGEPDESLTYGRHFIWADKYVQTDDGIVTAISVGWNSRGSAMKTKEGIGVGSSQLKVIATYGEPDDRKQWHTTLYLCYSSGMLFTFEDNSSSVTQVTIATKKRALWPCNN